MTAIVKALSRAPGIQGNAETFPTIAIFCGTGLVASLVLLLSGLDFSTGFF